MPLQEWIHALEEGRGTKVVRIFLAVLAFVAIAIAYDYFCFKNFNLPEAMDSAQLARNLSEGKGYTTDFIRPFSIHLLQEQRADHDALLKTAHPDLANAPVYPVLLAAWFKVMPVNFSIGTTGTFSTYQPERWIAALNQLLLFCAALLLFFLARRLFNSAVAWVSVLALAGSELIWHFSVSGLSTMLLLVLVLGAIFCLVRTDECQREETVSTKKLIGAGILAGVLIGLAGLTRYSFLWLIFPALLFIRLCEPGSRFKAGFIIVISFLIVVTPWLVRNKTASGAFFGISSYAVFEGTHAFPDGTLQRSLNPDLDKVTIKNFGNKLFVNIRSVWEKIPALGGSWIAAFFLAGLLTPFRNPSASRLRIFLISSLILFLIVQALGQTGASESSREVNADNLLIIFAPLVFVIGSAFFYVAIQQIEFAHPAKVQILSAIFVVIVSIPLLLALLPPRSYPSAYPPYHPPLIQKVSSLMKEDELMMSDVPGAVAWYGDRQCVVLTLDRDKEFFAINDDLKPVHALYLSPQTTDSRFLSEITQSNSWEQLVFRVALRGDQALVGFPLKSVRRELLPQHLLLTDWERWKMSGK
jgi:hypothetical protein